LIQNCNRILLFLAMLLVGLPCFASTMRGLVVGVTDGDTVTVLDHTRRQYKVRLMGIDAPEKSQPYGHKSKESLSRLAYGKSVSVTYNKKDKYGRMVGKITVDEVDICLEQIKAGMAWHYKKYETEQSLSDRFIYASAEDEAKLKVRGLWQDPHPVPPWAWRKQQRGR